MRITKIISNISFKNSQPLKGEPLTTVMIEEPDGSKREVKLTPEELELYHQQEQFKREQKYEQEQFKKQQDWIALINRPGAYTRVEK